MLGYVKRPRHCSDEGKKKPSLFDCHTVGYDARPLDPRSLFGEEFVKESARVIVGGLTILDDRFKFERERHPTEELFSKLFFFIGKRSFEGGLGSRIVGVGSRIVGGRVSVGGGGC